MQRGFRVLAEHYFVTAGLLALSAACDGASGRLDALPLDTDLPDADLLPAPEPATGARVPDAGHAHPDHDAEGTRDGSLPDGGAVIDASFGNDAPVAEASRDGGPRPGSDASPDHDGSSAVDAWFGGDASPSADAAAVLDASPSADASVGLDAAVPACADGTLLTRGCGRNGRGVERSACQGGSFGPFGACDDPDECVDKTLETRVRYAAASAPLVCAYEEQSRRCVFGRYAPWTGRYTYPACERVCSNGKVDPGETCDDGNARERDGCAGNCLIEPGYACPRDATGTSVCSPCVVLADATSAAAGADGSTWSSAYPLLRDALDAARELLREGTCGRAEVWVARGTYLPGPPGDRTASFVVWPGVSLYGGFGRTDTRLAERVVDPSSTVLSADLDGDDGRGKRDNNAQNVLIAWPGIDEVRIDGLTVYGGYDDGANADGAGVYAAGRLVLAHVLLRNNEAFGDGGAVAMSRGGVLEDVRMVANSSRHGGGGLSAYAGAGSTSDATLVLRDVSFEANRATSQGGGFTSQLPVDADGLRLEGNVSGGRGGGAWLSADGSRLRRAFVHDNRAASGGGVWVTGDTTLSDALFWRNSADAGPSALEVQYAQAVITNATFYGNLARSSAGAVGGYSPTQGPFAELRNSVVWGNQGGQTQPGVLTLFARNCVEGEVSTSERLSDCNVGATPFVDPEAGVFELAVGSSALDFGDSRYLVPGATDLAGRARLVGQSVDLGAYERP